VAGLWLIARPKSFRRNLNRISSPGRPATVRGPCIYWGHIAGGSSSPASIRYSLFGCSILTIFLHPPAQARFPSPVLVIPSAVIVIPSAAIVIPSAAIVIPSAAEESIEPPAPQHPANLRFTIQNSMFVIRYSSFSPPRPISPTSPTRPTCPICPPLSISS